MMDNGRIAYFSMEIGLDFGMPTYSGGLGILAGDTIRSAADMRVPMIAVTLIHRKGYFYQTLDRDGTQHEDAVEWVVDDFLKAVDARGTVDIEGRPVVVRAWRLDVKGVTGHVVPVFFLDTDLPENAEQDRRLTDRLYGGDEHYRLRQEMILGIGGTRLLRAMGFHEIRKFHMNEGHAAFLTCEIMMEHMKQESRVELIDRDMEYVQKRCVFTTHTPVPAGHDQFPRDAIERAFAGYPEGLVRFLTASEKANMTLIALNASHYVNGVAKKHGEVSRHMFARYQIDSITNGVHAATWVCPAFQHLFDKYIPGWREDNFALRYALSMPKEEVWAAHMEVKRKLTEYVNRTANTGLDFELPTIAFARRAATYKRAELLFHDVDRLMAIAEKSGPFQVIFAGKAHPRDDKGKDIIRRIFGAMDRVRPKIKMVYLSNYDIKLGKLLTAGADLWLNTPQPPMEASGTSGMKAALNGVPSMSVLDGWWIEGCIEDITGWSIGSSVPADLSRPSDPAVDAASLYDKIENKFLPAYNGNRDHFIDMMRHSIALNGSFFNTQRMMQEYVMKAYFL